MRAHRVLSILGEHVLLAVVVLALGACRVEAERFDESPQRVGEYEITLQLDPNPPKAGTETRIVVTVTRGGAPAGTNAVEPHLMVDMPEMPMGRPEVPLEAEGPGRWRGVVTFPMAGDWAATVMLKPEGSEARFRFEVGP